MISTVLFHVIDSKITYNILLGRPWLHENDVIPSTMHQCFKYCKDGHVKRVFGDVKPFTEAKSYLIDVKYYFQGADTTKTDKGANKDEQVEEGEKALPPPRVDKGK